MIPVTTVLTIDGPSGTGKTTICLQLAQDLGYNLLLSGLIYRIVAMYGRDDMLGFIGQIQPGDIRMCALNGQPACYLKGQECYQALMAPAVAETASQIAADPAVRAALLPLQHQFAVGQGLIAEGRDMGSVVFPKADLKIYLTASDAARASRRAKQLQSAGKTINIDELLKKMATRDARDTNRVTNPLTCPKSALIIDTSDLTIEEVMQQIRAKLHVV